ncbi:MAG: hypothetical protein IJV35_10715 [Neisseriaceae bacterium]|nr:hypothetical protein [Neisseriaceae bacterium]
MFRQHFDYYLNSTSFIELRFRQPERKSKHYLNNNCFAARQNETTANYSLLIANLLALLYPYPFFASK